jgi:hypothetical protein
MMGGISIASILLLGLVMVGAVLTGVAVAVARRAQRSRGAGATTQDGIYPKGYWQGMGIGIGLALGVGLGLALGSAFDDPAVGVAIGPGMGLTIGVAIGAGMEARHKNEIRSLSADGRRMRSRVTLAGIVLVSLGVLTFLGVLFSRFSG